MPNEMSMPKKMGMSNEMSTPNGHGGHLYMQTNEVKNVIVHYHRSANGTLTEVERVATGGAGSGTFKPISGQDSAPNSFEGAGSVILSQDRKFLFATNGGDNSVSSFAVGRPWQTHVDRHQADGERSRREERYREIAGLLALEGDALRGAFLRARSYPAYVGLQ